MDWIELPRARMDAYEKGAWLPVLDELAHAIVNCPKCGRGIPVRCFISSEGEVHPTLRCDKRTCTFAVSAKLKGWKAGRKVKLPPLDDDTEPRRGGRAKKGGW